MYNRAEAPSSSPLRYQSKPVSSFCQLAMIQHRLRAQNFQKIKEIKVKVHHSIQACAKKVRRPPLQPPPATSPGAARSKSAL